MTSFKDFQAHFKGDIVTSQDAGYEQAIDRWATNATRRAAVVAFVKGPEDVGLAVKYAREAALPIAIRGGGHSSAGTSSSENGLVIDLSRYLNQVRVDPEQKLTYVQGGATWKAVDEAAIKHGLAAVASTVNTTGVGGSTLGGGYGWLSGAHGLAIDNTVQVTVVTADGCVLTASETQNSDLFWGIRGGGSNFGVVTEFVFKLHPQRATAFAGSLIFHPNKVEQVGAFLDQWWPTAKPEEGMLVGLTRMHTDPIIIASLFFNGPEEEGRKRYKGLIDVGSIVDNTKQVPYEQVNGLMNAAVAWGSCHYFTGGLLRRKPSQDINSERQKRLLELAAVAPDFTITVMHEFIPRQKTNSVPANATPYRRDLPGNVLIALQWKDNTTENAQKAQEIAETIDRGPQAYGNYTPESDALPVSALIPAERTKALFGEAYPKLQAIKSKYDPEMVFNKWFNIVPA